MYLLQLSSFFPHFSFPPVLTKGIKMFLYIGNGRLNFIPHPMDRFSHFLRGTSSVNVIGTGKLEVAQVFIYYPKEIYDRLVLFEHAMQAGSCVTALKQVDKN